MTGWARGPAGLDGAWIEPGATTSHDTALQPPGNHNTRAKPVYPLSLSRSRSNRKCEHGTWKWVTVTVICKLKLMANGEWRMEWRTACVPPCACACASCMSCMPYASHRCITRASHHYRYCHRASCIVHRARQPAHDARRLAPRGLAAAGPPPQPAGAAPRQPRRCATCPSSSSLAPSPSLRFPRRLHLAVSIQSIKKSLRKNATRYSSSF